MILQEPLPLVSVIIPAYNGENWVAAAIQSALTQTYPRLEVLVIDDGSRDRTLEIARGIAACDARVRVLHQSNQGVARARNRGIQEAQGELIAPLDADDIWQPQKIKRQVERLLEAGPEVGLVYCWWVWIDGRGEVLDRSPRWTAEGDIVEFLLQINVTGNASVPLFRKRRVQDVGGYDETLAAANAGGCEDWDLALRVACGSQVAVVPEVLLGYRRTPGSMSAACETMWRSQQRVEAKMRGLCPDIRGAVLRRGRQQFALYLAGLSFWSGRLIPALRWGRRAGPWLGLRVAPHVLRMLLRRDRRRRRPSQTMVPGVALTASDLPGPLIPYDAIYRFESMARPDSRENISSSAESG